MAGVPGVHRQGLFESAATALGVDVAARGPRRIGHNPKHTHPTLVQGFEQLQRDVRREGRVRKIGYPSRIVGENRGPVFCEREAHPGIGRQIAVGDVMNELADGPASGPVGRADLGVGKPIQRGCRFDGAERRGYRWRWRARSAKAFGEVQIFRLDIAGWAARSSADDNVPRLSPSDLWSTIEGRSCDSSSGLR